MSDTLIKIPERLAGEVKDYLSYSGFVSISDACRSKLRFWLQNCKSQKIDTSEAELQRKSTLRNLLPVWVGNFRDNLPEIHSGKDIKELEKPKKGSFIVAGAGPSIDLYRHVSMIGYHKYKGRLIATDRILNHCIEEGVVPDYVVMLDCDPKIVDFINTKLVKENMDDIKAVIATTVNPKVLDVWKGEKYFFNAQIDYVPDDLSVSNFMQIMSGTNRPELPPSEAIDALKGKSVMNTCGGNVGSACWTLAAYLMSGYSQDAVSKYPIGLIGMDFGWPEKFPIEDTDYFPVYYKIAGGNLDRVKENYVNYYNPFFKNHSYSCRVFDLYRKTFTTWIEGVFVQDKVRTINCTGGGALFSDIIRQMKFEDFLKKYKR